MLSKSSAYFLSGFQVQPSLLKVRVRHFDGWGARGDLVPVQKAGEPQSMAAGVPGVSPPGGGSTFLVAPPSGSCHNSLPKHVVSGVYSALPQYVEWVPPVLTHSLKL